MAGQVNAAAALVSHRQTSLPAGGLPEDILLRRQSIKNPERRRCSHIERRRPSQPPGAVWVADDHRLPVSL